METKLELTRRMLARSSLGGSLELDKVLLAVEEDAWRLVPGGPGLDDVPDRLKAATPARFAWTATGGQHQNPRHLALLDRHLVDLAFGRIRRLAVFMPPRHGKSERGSRYFPAWYLGRFPDNQLMLASYAAALAEDMGRASRDALTEFGPSLFNVRIRQDSHAAGRWQLAGRRGVMRSLGVGGPATGRGAHVLIVDDPVKDAEEALSPTYRERVWQWFNSVAVPRLEPRGAILLIQTRWHEDDLSGRILDLAAKTGEEWTVLRLPALAEDEDPLGRRPGEALWPERFSAEMLEEIRVRQEHPDASMIADWFSCQYQQSPVSATGGFFDLANLPVTAFHPTPRAFTVRYWDKAASVAKSACRTAGVKMSVDTNGRYIVEHAIAVRMAPADREELIRATAIADGRNVLQVVEQEGGSSGADAILATARLLAGYPFEADRPSGDKETRAIPFASQCRAGNVVVIDDPTWTAEYRRELQAFPRGKLKDLVDASSGALTVIARRQQKETRAVVGGPRFVARMPWEHSDAIGY